MFTFNKEFDNMFKEEHQFDTQQDSWESNCFNSSDNYSFSKMNDFSDDNSQCFESTKIYQTKTKSVTSSFSGEATPERVEEKPVDVMQCFDISHIKSMIESSTTDLNGFLDSHVFFDIDASTEIKPLGEVQLTTSKRKIRKSPAQIKILKQAYDADDEWKREIIESLA
mmetsp:Transcript_36041/g.35645  ORF Transcript_36041/g.35645 Transcript_36041/m.35645 type:complete len:168 (-) Transcript_36041:161-664(-)